MKMKEYWLRIPGLPYYEASTLGRIRSLDRVVNKSNRWPGSYAFKIKGCVLSPRLNRQGYPRVNVTIDKRHRTMPVHVLVARAFLGERPPGLHINHMNGDKSDSRPENLEYCTQSRNELHAFKHGLKMPRHGSLSNNAKLTENDVREIVALRARGTLQKDLASKFGVKLATIRKILGGQTWRHVTGKVKAS